MWRERVEAGDEAVGLWEGLHVGGGIAGPDLEVQQCGEAGEGARHRRLAHDDERGLRQKWLDEHLQLPLSRAEHRHLHDARRRMRRLARVWREHNQPRCSLRQRVESLADDGWTRAVAADPALKLAIWQDDSPRAGRARGGLARGDDGGEREGAALVAQPLRLFKDIGWAIMCLTSIAGE